MSTQNLTNDEVDRIKQIFNQFDRNKNGSIDKKELYTLSIALNNPLSPAELQDFMRAFDKDNSSSISWEEFIDYWCSM
jgi:Ca2+-binding EF-hand superfamily protein